MKKRKRITRRRFLQTTAQATAFTIITSPRLRSENVTGPFPLEEMTVVQLQDAMKTGQQTARSLTEIYLARIDEVDKRGPAINSVIELNPDALAIAAKLDDERKAGKLRGPLHGL